MWCFIVTGTAIHSSDIPARAQDIVRKLCCGAVVASGSPVPEPDIEGNLLQASEVGVRIELPSSTPLVGQWPLQC